MATTEYNAVIKGSRLTDVYSDGGWQVATDAARFEALTKRIHTIRVSPIGHFNVGKTFIVNKLSGLRLPDGDRAHTAGLSVAVTAFAGKQQIAWLDTAGLNSPAVHSGAGGLGGGAGDAAASPDPEADAAGSSAHTKRAMGELREELREVKRMEEFRRAVAFEFADVLLFVVGQMSHEDQLNMVLLMKQIQASQGGAKQVFVVHNLRTWTREQLHRVRDDGYTYVTRIKTLFFMNAFEVNQTALVDANNELVVEGKQSHGQERAVKASIPKLEGQFGHDGNVSGISMLHMFVCDDAKEGEYNAAVFAHLRQCLGSELGVNEPVTAALERTMTAVQARFVEMDAGAKRPALQVVQAGEGGGYVVRAAGERGRGLTVQRVELDSYLTLESDALQFNVLKLLGRAAAKPGGDLATTKKVYYGLQFVLPGLTPDEVEAVRSVARFQGKGAALRLEAPEGTRVLTVDFRTVERALPKHTMGKVHGQLRAALGEGIALESECPTLHPSGGASSGFDAASLERPVAVQLRTGLSKVSALTKPVVSYNDGVLCIVVASTEKAASTAKVASSEKVAA